MTIKTPRKHHGRTIDTSIRIDSTPLRVWQAWADPEHIANWFVDRAEGVGKAGEVMTWFFDTFNHVLPVPIAEAEPGRTFVVSGGDTPGPHGLPYLMEITITQDEGQTLMRLVNSGFSDDANFDDEYEGVVSGWKMALATLKRWLERYPDRRRTHVLSIHPASYTWAALKPLVQSIEGRRRWLEPAVHADGAVLADTGREILLAVDPLDGVVGIKAFTMGPQKVVALDLSSWARDPQILANVEGDLRRALRRLSDELNL